ncbi:hypothetical protein ABKN59_011598 [Abortiporus biennis]
MFKATCFTGIEHERKQMVNHCASKVNGKEGSSHVATIVDRLMDYQSTVDSIDLSSLRNHSLPCTSSILY